MAEEELGWPGLMYSSVALKRSPTAALMVGAAEMIQAAPSCASIVNAGG
jgi:hypothetical protein